MQLSKHFTLEEFIYSPTAVYKKIDNTPSDEQIANMQALCLNVLEPIREKIGKPVKISSGFRCPALNKLIGGSTTSQHMEGKAADIHVDGMTTEELFLYICENFKFYQCIVIIFHYTEHFLQTPCHC